MGKTCLTEREGIDLEDAYKKLMSEEYCMVAKNEDGRNIACTIMSEKHVASLSSTITPDKNNCFIVTKEQYDIIDKEFDDMAWAESGITFPKP